MAEGRGRLPRSRLNTHIETSDEFPQPRCLVILESEGAPCSGGHGARSPHHNGSPPYQDLVPCNVLVGVVNQGFLSVTAGNGPRSELERSYRCSCAFPSDEFSACRPRCTPEKSLFFPRALSSMASAFPQRRAGFSVTTCS